VCPDATWPEAEQTSKQCALSINDKEGRERLARTDWYFVPFHPKTNFREYPPSFGFPGSPGGHFTENVFDMISITSVGLVMVSTGQTTRVVS
jgi:hypothetical protein